MGVHPERRLSPFQFKTFSTWWQKHDANLPLDRKTRGKVVYFHDTFTEYNYPRIGMAAVQLLEAAGFEVVIEHRRACCGRPMLSKGLLNDAKRAARATSHVLAPYAQAGIPIVGTEPSCILTLRDEYRRSPARRRGRRSGRQPLLHDRRVPGQAGNDRPSSASAGRATRSRCMFHGHCHQKALIGMGPSLAILKAAGCAATESGAGCCGMAGSFGYEAEHYDVSRKIGEERLFPAVAEQGEDTVIAVSGVSCRQQIEHFTERKTTHIVEVSGRQSRPPLGTPSGRRPPGRGASRRTHRDRRGLRGFPLTFRTTRSLPPGSFICRARFMNEIGGDDYPLRPKPSKGPLLDRLAHWLDRKTRTDYETDKPLIESEGPVLVERLAQARVTLTFMGAFRFTWDEVAVIAIRERLPIYSGGIAELVRHLTDRLGYVA